VNDVQGSNVLIVDDVVENLRHLSSILRRGGLIPRPVLSGRLAIEAAVVDPPDLVLLDIRMPDMSGIEIFRWFKRDERLRNIPIVFISGLQGADDKVEAFQTGGVDYLSRPFEEQELLVRVKTHLSLRRFQAQLTASNMRLEQRVAEQVEAISASQMATIFALAQLTEFRHCDTGKHVERVRTFAKILAEKMREMGLYSAHLTAPFINDLYQTAALHDIGKVGIADAILLKPGILTAEEFDEMKKHCVLGADTLLVVLARYPDNQFLRMGVDVARSHHEQWNGGGYPDRLSETATPLSARIVGLVDFYDALTSDRCYRPAVSHTDTCRMIHEGSGTRFEPDIATAFGILASQFQQVRQEMRN
jgi:putative two-component system response regulator